MSTIEVADDSGRHAAPKGKIPSPFLPGSTIGILGSGQLGRMSAMAAKALGYRVVVYDENPDGPAVSCADVAITAPFDDLTALARFAGEVDLATVEFENIPITALEFLEKSIPVRPSASVVRICQDRVLEKEFLERNGFPVAPFRVIASAEDLAKGIAEIGAPSILKTAVLGYDGKGQVRVAPGDDAGFLWKEMEAARAVLEKRISFVTEVSVICARSPQGESLCFPVQENVHREGILDVSVAPAGIAPEVSQRAQEITAAIAEKLDAVGLITAEFFVLADGSLMVNELAPRPHNSGHHTLETAMTSQFAQHVRAVCGLPLGPVGLRSPGVMINLLGDLWKRGEPAWHLLLGEPGLFLHLYGKQGAKPGRKMGHFTLLGDTEGARARALGLREKLAG
jgi:5-(carboxyamino)imidazole ribonucleotide synthase